MLFSIPIPNLNPTPSMMCLKCEGRDRYDRQDCPNVTGHNCKRDNSILISEQNVKH